MNRHSKLVGLTLLLTLLLLLHRWAARGALLPAVLAGVATGLLALVDGAQRIGGCELCSPVQAHGREQFLADQVRRAAQGVDVAGPSLSVVIPMYDEIDNVEPLVARVHRGLADYTGRWELICVDDGECLDGLQLLQEGTEVLEAEGVDGELARSWVDLFGISSVCNILAAIRAADPSTPEELLRAVSLLIALDRFDLAQTYLERLHGLNLDAAANAPRVAPRPCYSLFLTGGDSGPPPARPSNRDTGCI